MLKTLLIPLLPLLMLFSDGSDNSAARLKQINIGSDHAARSRQIINSADNSVTRLKSKNPVSQESQTGTLEKMIVASGSISMDIDLNQLNGIKSAKQLDKLQFAVVPNSFFTVLVFENALRGPETGSMALIPQSFAVLPAALTSPSTNLLLKRLRQPNRSILPCAMERPASPFLISRGISTTTTPGRSCSASRRAASDFKRVCCEARASVRRRFSSGKDFGQCNYADHRNHAVSQRRS